MEIAGLGQRVRIYIGEQDRAPGHHEPLWQTILDLLRTEGAAGATLLRGVAGFGAHSQLHTARLADLAPDLPVILEWIDGPERIERLLPRVCELVHTGTVTLEDVQMVKYTHRPPHALPPDRVSDVMTRDVVSVSPSTPLVEVVRLLVARDFRVVPVLDADQRLVGIITNRDLVERGGVGARLELLARLETAHMERELAPILERTALDVMTPDVLTVAPDTSLRDAAHLMASRRLKRLPVLSGDRRLAGMLSRVDVLRTMGETYPAPFARLPARSQPVRAIGDLMRSDVPTVLASAPLGEVLDAVTSTRLNRAIVVDTDRRPLGVISDAELLSRLDPAAQSGVLSALMGRGHLGANAALTATQLMHAPALSVSSDTSIAEAAQQMLQARHKLLPITDAEGHLLGAVDRADLLTHFSPEQQAAQP